MIRYKNSSFVISVIYLTSAINNLGICNCVDNNDKNERGEVDSNANNPEILIPELGNLKGTYFTTHHGRRIHGFLGIPFAQPPIGDLRFKSPLAAPPWNGTLDATKDANFCPQVSNGGVIGNEDCLYLNVYTPQLPSNGSATDLAVMVWIYGGAFHTGASHSTQTGPGYLLDKNIILVVPNYRLGPLGFLSTGDEVSPGNYGMKDQVLTLKWIEKNIQYFGGDANKVTIFGTSAGAASVDYLALSESSKGLFHSCIKISGASLSPRAFVPRDILVEYSYRLGDHLGCTASKSIALIDCLRKLNAEKIVNTTTLFFEWNNYPAIIWRPTNEPTDIADAFLTDTPANLYAAGKFANLSCISGTEHDEGLYFSKHFYENPDLFDDFLNKLDHVLPYVLLYQHRHDASNLTNDLKAYYLNDLTADREVLLANVTQLMGDVYHIYPTYSANKKQFLLGKSPQYYYSFEYLRTYKYKNDTVLPPGNQHGDIKPFFFPLEKMSESDMKMVDIIVSLWTSYAVDGVPTLPAEYNLTWTQYSSEDNYLRIGKGPDISLEMKNSLFKDRMLFWKNFTATYQFI